jgi:hypothetical protein
MQRYDILSLKESYRFPMYKPHLIHLLKCEQCDGPALAERRGGTTAAAVAAAACAAGEVAR